MAHCVQDVDRAGREDALLARSRDHPRWLAKMLGTGLPFDRVANAVVLEKCTGLAAPEQWAGYDKDVRATGAIVELQAFIPLGGAVYGIPVAEGKHLPAHDALLWLLAGEADPADGSVHAPPEASRVLVADGAEFVPGTIVDNLRLACGGPFKSGLTDDEVLAVARGLGLRTAVARPDVHAADKGLNLTEEDCVAIRVAQALLANPDVVVVAARHCSSKLLRGLREYVRGELLPHARSHALRPYKSTRTVFVRVAPRQANGAHVDRILTLVLGEDTPPPHRVPTKLEMTVAPSGPKAGDLVAAPVEGVETYSCERGCGFTGGFDDVTSHEAACTFAEGGAEEPKVDAAAKAAAEVAAKEVASLKTENQRLKAQIAAVPAAELTQLKQENEKLRKQLKEAMATQIQQNTAAARGTPEKAPAPATPESRKSTSATSSGRKSTAASSGRKSMAASSGAASSERKTYKINMSGKSTPSPGGRSSQVRKSTSGKKKSMATKKSTADPLASLGGAVAVGQVPEPTEEDDSEESEESDDDDDEEEHLSPEKRAAALGALYGKGAVSNLEGSQKPSRKKGTVVIGDKVLKINLNKKSMNKAVAKAASAAPSVPPLKAAAAAPSAAGAGRKSAAGRRSQFRPAPPPKPQKKSFFGKKSMFNGGGLFGGKRGSGGSNRKGGRLSKTAKITIRGGGGGKKDTFKPTFDTPGMMDVPEDGVVSEKVEGVEAYHCEFECGFEGTFEECCAHEPHCHANPERSAEPEQMYGAAERKRRSWLCHVLEEDDLVSTEFPRPRRRRESRAHTSQ